MTAIAEFLRSIWDGIAGRINRHPVRAQALVQAIIGVATAFGLNWDVVQVAAVMVLSASVLAFLTEQAVTPTASPVLEMGTVIRTPDGREAVVTPKWPEYPMQMSETR